ncbi:MAG TPA: hypothetical protein VK121_08855 [Pseudogracilibacillus sp.]|nr:hypothetical protein [Pseudogracilibacillus sp.]
MRKYDKPKYKRISIMLVLTFILIIAFPFLVIKFGNYYANPHNKYRAEHATSTGHTIIIDDHYWVSTTSASESKLVYTEQPINSSPSVYDEIYSHSVDKLNWTEDFILVGAESESTGNFSYMILDRETGDTEGYANEDEFEKGKEEKRIDVDVLDKKYFDWY